MASRQLPSCFRISSGLRFEIALKCLFVFRDNRLSVYVGNLPPNTIQGHFDYIFAGCDVGPLFFSSFIVQIESVRLVRDKQTDEFKGYAYVDFKNEQSLQKALAVDGAVCHWFSFYFSVQIVDGRSLRVNLAGERPGRGMFIFPPYL